PPRAIRLPWDAIVASAVAVAGLAAGLTWLLTRPAPPPPAPVAHFVTPLPVEAMPLRGNGAGVVFSPDGTTVIYAGQAALLTTPQLFRRKLNAIEVEAIPNTEAAYAPFFSPDGKWLGFFTDTSVMKMDVEGGLASKICNRGRFSRAAWAPDDTIVLGTSLAMAPGALGRVPASGGEPAPLTTLAGKEVLHQSPHILPDGRHVIFGVVSPDSFGLAIAPLAGGAHTLLNIEGGGPQFVAPDHLVFGRGDAVFAVGFDPKTSQVRGTPVQVLDDAGVSTVSQKVPLPLVGADRRGSVAYVNKGGTVGQLRWMPDSSTLAAAGADYGELSLSPDGRRAVVTIGQTSADAWTIDLERGTRLRLTTGGARSPAWSPDGSRIAYWSTETGLMTVASDGSGSPHLFLARSKGGVLLPSSWSQDGRALVVTAEGSGAQRGARNRDLVLVRAGEQPVPILATPADERAASVSPDGHWIAYASSVGGREEVYVRPLVGAGATVP